jgi:HDOD domain
VAPATATTPALNQYPANALVSWLVDAPQPQDRALSQAEALALAHLRSLLDPSKHAAELLPRAGAVIPRLLALMRNQNLAIAAMCDQVARDKVLTAEVLRLATSALYLRFAPPRNLEDAVTRIGSVGLRAAIARIVLRPVLRGGSGLLNEEAEARCWAFSNEQAHLMGSACLDGGRDRFEGYMLGLVHSSGWTVALRAMDVNTWPPGTACSRAFAEQLNSLKDQLFAKVAGSWRLSPDIDALCAEALQHGLDGSTHLLASPLRQSELQAAQQMLAPTLGEPMQTPSVSSGVVHPPNTATVAWH